MHHTPSGPPLAERLVTALYRALRPLRGRILVRPRVATMLLGSVVIGLIAAAVPLRSTTADAPPPVALDASSSPTHGGARTGQAARTGVVEMGIDGTAAPSSASGTSATSAGTSSASAPASEPAAAKPATGGAPAARPPTGAAPAPSASALTSSGTPAGSTTSSSVTRGAPDQPLPPTVSSQPTAPTTGPVPTTDPVPTAGPAPTATPTDAPATTAPFRTHPDPRSAH